MNATIDTSTWRKRVSAAKEAAKQAGRVTGDADIATAVSELIGPLNEGKIQRTTVSHWLSGRRTPNVTQFVALCKAVGLDPAVAIAGNSPSTRQVTELYARDSSAAALRHHDQHIAKVIELMEAADTGGRQAARAAVVVVLNEQSKSSVNKKQQR